MYRRLFRRHRSIPTYAARDARDVGSAANCMVRVGCRIWRSRTRVVSDHFGTESHQTVKSVVSHRENLPPDFFSSGFRSKRRLRRWPWHRRRRRLRQRCRCGGSTTAGQLLQDQRRHRMWRSDVTTSLIRAALAAAATDLIGEARTSSFGAQFCACLCLLYRQAYGGVTR